MNFLIVEDEEDVCLAMVCRLKDIRANPSDEVFHAFSSAEAVKILAGQRIDCLITDIRMPGQSGLDLIEQIANARRDLRCIVVTAYDDFAYAQRALRLGCVDFLLKPFSRQAFKEAVERALSPIEAPAPDRDEGALKLEWVKAYVKAHISENLDMSYITSQLYMSYAYFSRKFKEETGRTFSDFLLSTRMKEAQRLLLSGVSVGGTAEAVGYANIYGFTRAFTRFAGMPPTQWLKAHAPSKTTI